MRSRNRFEKKPPAMRSLAAIAELLDCEGFDEYAANQVIRYASKQGRDVVRNKQKAMGAVLSRLTEDERKVVGSAIHHMTKESFDAGLRLGLMAHVTRQISESE